MTYSFPQRFLEEDSSCEEYGCSYSKDGAPGEVYCFKDGSYQVKAGDECPVDATGFSKAFAMVHIWAHRFILPIYYSLMLSQSAL